MTIYPIEQWKLEIELSMDKNLILLKTYDYKMLIRNYYSLS